MTFLAGRKVMWWTVKKGHFRRVRRGGGGFLLGGGGVGREETPLLTVVGSGTSTNLPPPWKPPPPPVSSGGDGVADTASASESPYLSMIARSQKKNTFTWKTSVAMFPRGLKRAKREKRGVPKVAPATRCVGSGGVWR